MRKILIVMSCMMFSHVAIASYFAQDGHSSMQLRSADVLEKGQVALDLSVFADSYSISGGTLQDEDGYVLPGFSYGLNEDVSLALTAPVIAVSNSTVGLREINGVAKYRLGGGRDEGVAVSLSAYAGLLSTAQSEGLGSGERGYGLAMNISLYGDVTTLNLSLGGEKSDIKTPGLISGFSSEQQLMLAAGIEYRPGDSWQYLLEGVFTRTNEVDDNFLLMPGVRYSPDQRMSFYAGMALGLPSDTSMPEWRVTTGVNINLGVRSGNDQARHRVIMSPVEQASAIASVTDPLSQHITTPASTRMAAVVGAESGVNNKAAVTGLSASDAMLLQQIEALRNDVGKLINTPPNVIAKVEIQNASGIRGLGEKVAKLLTNRGYSVVSISDIARPVDRPTKIYYKAGPKNAEIVHVDRARLGVRKQTRIYFIEGFQQRATRVSLALPGSQRVMADTDLINVAEIRLVIGKDMKALLKMRPIKQPST